MDIRELRYFSAVFTERNLAAITNLEAELGITLFIRHKKGMAPTEAPSNSTPSHGVSSMKRMLRGICFEGRRCRTA
jgi:hypothetical protein